MSKSLMEMVSNGQICAAYGKNYLISICPAFDIDRIRISAIKLNTKGKVHNDIYLSTEEARIFFDEVDRGIAVKKFEADKASPYPQAYIYTKGNGGSKRLQIGGGNSGIRIQITNPGKDNKMDHKLSAVQLTDLQTASFLFKLLSGLVPFVENSYYAKVYHAYWDNAARFSSRAADYNESEDGNYTGHDDTSYASDIVTVQTRTTGNAFYEDGYTIIPVLADNTPGFLAFDQTAEMLPWFTAYLQRVANGAVDMRISGIRRNDTIYFVSAA